jgi:hypothetical protein
MVIMIFTLTGLTISQITQNLLGRKYALIALLATYINFAVVRMSWDMFANFFAFFILSIILFLFTTLIKNPNTANKFPLLILISFFWGSLFNLHAIVAFGSLAIIGFPVAYLVFNCRNWLINHKALSIKLTLIFLVCFSIAAYPLLFTSSNFILRGLIKPLSYNLSQVNSSAQTTNASAPPEIIQESIKPRSPISQFPLRKSDFINSYTVVWVLFALIGLLTLFRKTKFHKTNELNKIILIFSLPLFILTQQELLGFNWYPSRFVLGAYLVIIPLSLFGIHQIKSLSQFTKLNISNSNLFPAFIFIFYLLPAFHDSVTFLYYGYKPSIEPHRYLFNQELKNYITTTKAQIFSTSTQPHWAPGLNPEFNIKVISRTDLCAPTQGSLVSAFTQQSDLNQSLDILQIFAQSQPYYIILDTQNNCIHAPHFLNTQYSILNQSESVYLIERTYN